MQRCNSNNVEKKRFKFFFSTLSTLHLCTLQIFTITQTQKNQRLSAEYKFCFQPSPWPLSNNVDHCLESLLQKFRLMTSTHHCVGGHGGKAQHDSKKKQNYKNEKIHQNWKWTKNLGKKPWNVTRIKKWKPRKKHITSKGKHKGKIKNSKTSPKICKSPKVKINQKNLRKKASNLTKIGNMKI